MKKGKLIVISGPSGVGKDTVVKELLKNNDNFELETYYEWRLRSSKSNYQRER